MILKTRHRAILILSLLFACCFMLPFIQYYEPKPSETEFLFETVNYYGYEYAMSYLWLYPFLSICICVMIHSRTAQITVNICALLIIAFINFGLIYALGMSGFAFRPKFHIGFYLMNLLILLSIIYSFQNLPKKS